MYIGKSHVIFLREQLERKYTISSNFFEIGVAWLTEKLFNQMAFNSVWANVTIINRLCVSDYSRFSIMVLCPFAHH